MTGDTVLTRDTSSGRIHKRVRNGDHLLTFEGCNLDQAGAYEVLTAVEAADALATAEPWQLCENDFGPQDRGE